MTVADFFGIFTTMFAFLPSWFALSFAMILGLLCGIILFKVVGFVMDVLPFV